MKLAAQLYTVRKLVLDASSLPDVLRRLREIGYQAVEVAGLEAPVQERLEQGLKEAGLAACAAHVSLEAVLADTAGVAELAHRWRCDYVVVPSMPAEYQLEQGYRRFAELAVRLAGQLRGHGLGLAYHNHAFELERLDGGRTGLDVLYASTTGNDLSAELDTYWLQYAGASPAGWIRRLAGRVPIVHMKDMAIAGGKQVQAAVGEGNLDWPSIVDACREAGTDWVVVEHDDCEGDPLDSLAVSYANLRRLLSGHA